ncbi:MAG: (d)CMP kinase [Myxococcales bacterium]|nr:MAG: (d)CMP kinase [Myxococcales bacterium]
MSTDCFVVAIDGPAGAGKSTVARRVADALELGYLDTGALYRAVALAAIEGGTALDDAAALAALAAGLDVEMPAGSRRIVLAGRDVSDETRTPQISQAASRVSALPGVRSALVELQRSAARPPGTVAEGRDMGTVIFPHADLKVFLDANPDERARRRAEELRERTDAKRDGSGDLENVKRDMAERDRRDRTREVAPLEAAADALVIDSTLMAIDEVVETIVKEAFLRRLPK